MTNTDTVRTCTSTAFAMAQEFWINLSRVDLFPVVQNNNKILEYVTIGLRPRDGGVSNSPPTAYETPLKFL